MCTVSKLFYQRLVERNMPCVLSLLYGVAHLLDTQALPNFSSIFDSFVEPVSLVVL